MTIFWPEPVTAAKCRYLCRPISIDQLAVRQPLQHSLYLKRSQDVASGKQLLKTGKIIESAVYHGVEQAGRQPEGSDALSLQEAPQILQSWDNSVEQHEPATMQQAPPNLKGRG